MTDEKPRVIIIPPKPELQQTAAVTKQLRVAAYCRVSTKEEEQASSYEAQCEYYTDKIMSNKEWTMAGIFADEGITGTSTKKRTEFLRMIRQCKQKKIDLILTKSIQRFARNTLDCINYTRILRQLGIGVLFEKENINSLPPDSEFMITMYGSMAQSESESISGNIRRGRQMHAKVGTLKVPCYRLYGDGEIFLGGNRRERAVDKCQTASTFCRTAVDTECNAVFGSREIVITADFKCACLNVYFSHADCTGFAGVGNCRIICANDVAIYQRDRQRGRNRA